MKASDSTSAAVQKAYLSQVPVALLNAFNTNNRINQYLIDGLAPSVWTSKPPEGKGRTIAAIVAHVHNVRVMWLKATKAEEVPEQLDRNTVTRVQALRAIESSRHALSVVMDRAIRGRWPD